MKRYSLILLSLLGSLAHAQAWNENVVTWTAPTTCTNGTPVSNCPVTGYRLERSSSATGTFAAVGTTTATTFTHTVSASGVNCYRAIAISANGESGPTNVACRTNTAPPPVPSPPTNLQFVTTVFVGHSLINATPVFRLTGNPPHLATSTLYGLVPLGRVTQSGPIDTYRRQSYCRVEVGSRELSGTTDPNNLAAPCAPRA